MCKDDAACDKDTGKCPAGCEAGWEDQNCQTPICDGKYCHAVF